MARIRGNNQNNNLKGTKKADQIFGLGGDDLLKGKGDNDKLVGGSGDDTLVGGPGDDTMKGGGGDDFMKAGEGQEKFIGGKGIDTVSYEESKLGINVDLLNNDNTGGAQFDIFKKIENVDGSLLGDEIEGDGAANRLRGLEGDDYLKGGAGNDVLDGGEGRDQIYADAGSDDLIGGNGIDSLVYEKASSGATINLATGNGGGSAAGDTFDGFETVFGTKFADTITGANADETFFGEQGNDHLFGGSGDDTLFGDQGADDLHGDQGDDRLSPEGDVIEADHMFGGNGSDWVDYDNAGAAVQVNLRTGLGGGRAAGDTYDGIENVQGSDFGDTILVAGLKGRAYGGSGNDFIYDNTSNEVLRGQGGADHLIDDALLVNPEDGKRDNFFLEVGLGMDTVQGFTQGNGGNADRFWLPEAQFGAIGHNANGTLLNANQIFNTTTSVATTATQRLIFDTSAGDQILYYDADGSGANAAPIAVAKILGLGAIALSDFVVVPDL